MIYTQEPNIGIHFIINHGPNGLDYGLDVLLDIFILKKLNTCVSYRFHNGPLYKPHINTIEFKRACVSLNKQKYH